MSCSGFLHHYRRASHFPLSCSLFYGLNFTPPSYVAQRAGGASYPDASPNLVDYVFPHFCGIFMATTAYMLLYSALKKNKPVRRCN